MHARARTHTHAGGVHMRVRAGVPVVQHRRVRKKRAEAVRAGEMLRDRDKPVGTMHALMNLQRSNSCQAEVTLQSLRLVPMRINAGCSVLDRAESAHHRRPRHTVPQVSCCQSRTTGWSPARDVRVVRGIMGRHQRKAGADLGNKNQPPHAPVDAESNFGSISADAAGYDITCEGNMMGKYPEHDWPAQQGAEPAKRMSPGLERNSSKRGLVAPEL